MTPLLITTANNPPTGTPHLKMEDLATRAIAAKSSVFYFASLGAKNIVIADATGINLLNVDDLSYLSQMGIQVEQINYTQDHNAIISKGKGFGEGELINFSLSNSKLLQRYDSFFKCTGKVHCRNFNEIEQMISQNNVSNIFWHFMDNTMVKPWVDTRFFYADKNFARSKIIPIYKSCDDKVAAIEHLLYPLLNDDLSQAKAVRPLLSGFSGGTGLPYFDASLGILDITFPCWLSIKN